MNGLIKLGSGVIAGAIAVSGVMIAQAGDSNPSHYTVDRDDTWQSIAASHGVTADVMQVSNDVAASTPNGAHPRTGWILHIPEVTPSPTNTSTSTTSTTSTSTSTTSTTAPPTPPTASVPRSSSTTTAPAASTTTTMPPMDHDCPGMSYTPIGAIAPATPMFCMPLAAGVADTFVQGPNSWVDDFDHGASMAALGGGYRVFEAIDEIPRSVTFRHNEHWMVDLGPEFDDDAYEQGGSYLRADRAFRFQNGVLVVEMDVAATIDEYEAIGGWPEIVISTAAAPTERGSTPIPDEGYAYGHFRNAHTIGIRLDQRVPIAALFNPGNTRTWEKSYFQTEGATNVGGYPEYAPGAWRTCRGSDPDVNCRDRFRWEIRRDSITLFVNGQLYWRQSDIPAAHQIPEAMLNRDVYVYAASWVVNPQRTVRFHWDRYAVNP